MAGSRLHRLTAAHGGVVLVAILMFSGGPARGESASTSCRASAARASGSQQATAEPVVANPAATPCATQDQQLAGAQSVGGMTVTNPRASTENASGTLSASASDDSAQFQGATAIGVGHVSVNQAQSCTSGTNIATGSSRVDGLIVAGTPVSVVGGQSIDQTIAGVRVRTNQLSGSTRQALVLDVGSTEYVLGEASASGDACASLPAGGGSGGSGGAGGGGGSLAGASGSGLGAGSGVIGGTLSGRLAASQLALQCPRRRLILIDVLQRGTRVALLGAADKSLIGRKVTITFLANHKRVASAVVGSDGFFGTTAALPSRRVRFTNRASYQASIGAERSASLKLTRRMLVDSIVSRAGKVVIHGRVVRPLAQPIATILVRRRVSCSSAVTVKRIKPRRNGTFAVTLVAPPRTQAAVYLAVTRVRQTVRNRRTYPTSTLPRVVVIK
jgi:hypothetical protein